MKPEGASAAAADAALAEARASGLRLILRMQEMTERRTVVADGRVDRERISRTAGLGVHVFTEDGAVGFASVDDLRPEAVVAAVQQAGLLARATSPRRAPQRDPLHSLAGASALGASALGASALGASALGASALSARRRCERIAQPAQPSDAARRLADAQQLLAALNVGADRTVRTSLQAIDERWRIVRSDGCDVCFDTSRVAVRHELGGRIDGRAVRAGAHLAGDASTDLLDEQSAGRLAVRLRRAANDAVAAASAPPPREGSYRLVLNHALAKGLAHEAIGHLCETDVDGSVLMRGGRLRLGEQLARGTVSIVDGPLPGDFVQQPVSANGIERQTVRLIDRGVLTAGLGDLFSAEQAGAPVTGACRASSYRDRPTPRMTNIRIEVAGALPLDADPEGLTPDDVLRAVRQHGLIDRSSPTLYLAGYRGGQAHPRRGDFVFGADAAYDLSDGGRPLGPASFSGLAERALAAIRAGIGPLCTDAIGSCGKDGSAVSSSGGSHALLVLDADPDLVVTAAP
ncbi:MAG: hypothetical protein IT306_00565 [Chloroflexi bacterium]|nr:hypothetical protein [Chloroflexota bacterium]